MIAARERSELERAERLRLEQCALEPIRTPGAIQAHGILLALDPISHVIALASDNAEAFVGMPSESLLGMGVAEVLGGPFLADLLAVLRAGPLTPNTFAFERAGRVTDVIVHKSRDHIVVEFEPILDAADFPAPLAVYEAVLRLAGWTTIDQLRAGVVRELRALAGFDRVMAYHFHPDGHGEIVAEAVADELEPYLGLHYPASDIPPQARQLYLSKLSRSIVSTSTPPVALVGREGGDDPATFDLSFAELRSVSPQHLEFMRNMKQESTLSLSMVRDGALIGMITCAHGSPRRLPLVLRRGLEVFANHVALRLGSIQEIDRLKHQAGVASLRTRLLGQLAGSESMATALLDQQLTVLDLVPADGAVLFIDGVLSSVGFVPAEEHTRALIQALDGLSFATNALALEHPALAALLPEMAGVLVVPLGGEGDYLAFFRQEVLRTVNWLGDQRLENRLSPLSPRMSFSAWSQSVTSTAQPWGELVDEAGELARDLEGALLQRAESKLAELAQHDPLTGLPNRRLLMDSLAHALARHARGGKLALLFVDLDGFKAVNDAYGHEAGDGLLLAVAQRLLAATRVEDTVARIGGDEFVILCGDATAEEAHAAAQRVVDAIRRPLEVGGVLATVTASVGIASAGPTSSAVELLQQADAAMYRAKTKGKNQVSR